MYKFNLLWNIQRIDLYTLTVLTGLDYVSTVYEIKALSLQNRICSAGHFLSLELGSVSILHIPLNYVVCMI